LSIAQARPGARLQAGLLFALACPAVHAATYSLPPPPRFDTVPQLDEALDQLRKMSWALYSDALAQPDSRGRTIAHDVNQWLLSPDHEERLAALRARAQSQSAAADSAALQATLGEAATRVQQERCFAAVLAGYWRYRELLARHEARLQALKERLPQDEPAARQRRIAPLVMRWAGALSAAMSADSLSAEEVAVEELTRTTEQLFSAYNEERGELASSLSTQERAQGKAPLTQTRQTPCQEPHPQTSGSPKPRLAVNNRALEEVYPASSKHALFEGRTVIDASVSANGCAEQAAVYQSSGVEELDDAALRWTLQAHFLPGERDHQAVTGVVRFAVKFVLSAPLSYQGWSP